MSTAVIIVVLFMLIGGFFLFRKKKPGSSRAGGGMFDDLKSRIFRPEDNQTAVARYRAEAAEEARKGEELREVLRAKQELAVIKQNNQKLLKDIEAIDAGKGVVLQAKLPSAKLKRG